ncbi:hypothetical protein LCGC14_1337580, partial [marine sediment metagenome]
WDEGNELGSHVPFMLAIKQAEADLVDSQLGVIQDAGNKGMWAAAMTLLERRFPQDFGRNQRIEVSNQTTIIHRLELGSALEHILLRAAELGSPAGLLTEGDGTASISTTRPVEATPDAE